MLHSSTHAGSNAEQKQTMVTNGKTVYGLRNPLSSTQQNENVDSDQITKLNMNASYVLSHHVALARKNFSDGLNIKSALIKAH